MEQASGVAKTPGSKKRKIKQPNNLPTKAITKNSTMQSLAQVLSTKNETSKSKQGFVETKSNNLADIKLEPEWDNLHKDPNNISTVLKHKCKGTIPEPEFIELYKPNAMKTNKNYELDCPFNKQNQTRINTEDHSSVITVNKMDTTIHKNCNEKKEEIDIKLEENNTSLGKQEPIVIKVEADNSTNEVNEMDKYVYEEWKGKNEEINIKLEENNASIFLKKRRNYRTKHLNEVTKFKCEQCNFQSQYKTSLKLHLLKHKNTEAVIKPRCDQCKCVSDRKNNLKTPLVKQKNPKEVSKFKCDQCNFQSPYKTSLKLHLIKHKSSEEVDKFKCDQCK